MKKYYGVIVLALALFLFQGMTVSAQPTDQVEQKLNEAWVAYNIGQYKKVLQLVQPLASDGNARAQIILGRCYENGLGVPRILKLPHSGSINPRRKQRGVPGLQNGHLTLNE